MIIEHCAKGGLHVRKRVGKRPGLQLIRRVVPSDLGHARKKLRHAPDRRYFT